MMTHEEEAQLAIRHFKLTSGDEVIAIVADIADDLIILEHAMSVNTSITERGFAFFFATWQPMSNDDRCYINPMHVISFVDCSSDIRERYLSMCVRGNTNDTTKNSELHQPIGLDDDNTADEDETDSEYDEFLDTVLHKSGTTRTVH